MTEFIQQVKAAYDLLMEKCVKTLSKLEASGKGKESLEYRYIEGLAETAKADTLEAFANLFPSLSYYQTEQPPKETDIEVEMIHRLASLSTLIKKFAN